MRILIPIKNPRTLLEILVVDDDTRLLSLLNQFLTQEQFLVRTAADTMQARDVLKMHRVDVLVLDIMLPKEDGITFLKTLSPGEPPVLLLTARDTLDDKIMGFETGAADYLTKPFEPKELSLRILSLFKRTQVSRISLGAFVFDPKRGELFKENTPVPLSSTEEILLKALLSNTCQPCSREDLSQKAGTLVSFRTIDMQIARLRKKLEDTQEPYLIRTVRHLGYALFPR